jgi:(E)-4-hydroxy-3-methylbut-2-enyl-diphosphate synthase
LSVGASEPVRVELDLGAPPMNDLDDWAAGHAKSIAKLRDVECESLQVSTAGALELGTLETVRKALSAAGLNQPLAVACRDGADLDADNSAGFAALISRVVVDVRNDSTADDCAAAATFAEKVDVALEWRVCGEVADLSGPIRSAASASREARLTRLLFSTNTSRQNHAARLLTAELAEQGLAQAPIVLRHSIGVEANSERATIDMAIDLGAPLCEGIGDLVSVSGSRALDQSTDQAYRVLQGARLRATRTEFISCPSCGRTLFDLEEVTARIKSKTDHLKGVKIAIMGCIVNGPGEMADADFGYVGSGVGRVTLYVGKEVFVRSIAEDQASDRLVELIKDSGRWVDPA